MSVPEEHKVEVQRLPPPRQSCIQRLVGMVLFLSTVGLAVALFFAFTPQDLSGVRGRGGALESDAADARIRDMKAVLRGALDRGFTVTLEERELNRWLAATMSAKQSSTVSKFAQLTGVWVKLHDGYAELIFERTINGWPMTQSAFLKIEQTETPKGIQTAFMLNGGPYHSNLPYPPRGGRIGRLVVPQGFILLLRPALSSLAQEFRGEIELGFRDNDMERITIEEGKLILAPRSMDFEMPPP